MKKSEYIANPNLKLKEKLSVEELNKLALDDIEELILQSEEKYHKQIRELVEDFSSYNYKKIILLAGPTSAGKTTTSHLVRKELEKRGKKTVTISLDDFFLEYEKRPRLKDGTVDNESIDSIDVPYIESFTKELIETGKANMPIYNFIKRAREPQTVEIKADENTVIIFEGLHALNPKLFSDMSELSYRIFLAPNVDFYLDNKLVLQAKNLRLMRRCIRDTYSRGTMPETTLSMWKFITDCEEIYIKPYKYTADYIINSTHNYEPLVYAKYLKPLLETTENNEMANELIEILNACEKVNKKFIPDNSMIWEFLVHKD